MHPTQNDTAIKRGNPMKRFTTITCILAMIAGTATGGGMTPVKVNGKASFAREGKNLTVTTRTRRTAIDWNRFDVASGGRVHFQQPAASSSVFNRVVGAQASHINGLLSSNGAVYLINPHGIVVGPDGVIRVAEFVGSTLPADPEDYLAGRDLHFAGESFGGIENHGTIEAVGGDVYLFSERIENTGRIAAPEGAANLVAASDVLLTQDHEIFVRPNPERQREGVGIENSGTIEAVTARLEADGNMYALAINSAGTVRATGAVSEGGRVVLKADGGAIRHTGQIAAKRGDSGGEVEMTAADIEIAEEGGIDADADGGGRGGEIIVFAEQAAEVAGTLSARGTVGGFVETSGEQLDITGMALSIGDGGQWLLDPSDVTVGPVEAAAIGTQLDAGADVTVNADNSVTVNAPIFKSTTTGAPVLLLETATGPVTLNADIGLATGALAIHAGGGAFQNAGRIVAPNLELQGRGTFMLLSPTNNFNNIAADVSGGSADFLAVQDVNWLGIGSTANVTGLTASGTGAVLFMGGGMISVNEDVGVPDGALMVRTGGIYQSPGTTVKADQLQFKGSGFFSLTQPTNDFGTVGVAVEGAGSFVAIQDANDLRIGNVGTAHGVKVVGGQVHIATPNGSILAEGLFPDKVIAGYHALGNVEIAERSWLSEDYELLVSNDKPAATPKEMENFLGLEPGTLAGLADDNIEGSAVLLEFNPIAADTAGYDWNFKVRETFSGLSANDYSFTALGPVGSPELQILSDLEGARDAGIQESGLFSWQTGWAANDYELNHEDPYALRFGVLDVTNDRFLSRLLVRDIRFTGHIEPPPPPNPTPPTPDLDAEVPFIFERIFDRVDDFPGVRPDERQPIAGDDMLVPVLNMMSTYFDQAAQSTDHTYWYQSVGSVYQIPR